MPGAELLSLLRPLQVRLIGKRRPYLIPTVAIDHVDARRIQRASRGDHMSVMYQHVQGKAKQAAEVNPSLPKPLSELVTKCMSVDKMKRFQSMDELREALEKALS